ncbi:hypothetical protein YB2330_001182 [Saitoella coloradoensis]
MADKPGAHRSYSFTTLGTTMLYGAAAGVVGVTVLTVTNKIEQFFSGRPDSYVPAHTLERLLGLPDRPDSERWAFNQIEHYVQGAVPAMFRALMSLYGITGPLANFSFSLLRQGFDQVLENWTGVGAPPWTWPVYEQWIDLFHKTCYAFTVGYLTDMWFPGVWPVGDGNRRGYFD